MGPMTMRVETMDDSRMQQGESLFREGRVDEAEACFQAVLGDNPANAQALSNLGVLAVSRKDVGRAEHFFLEALKADGEHLASLSNLADLYIERQVWANALSCLTQSCELAPGRRRRAFWPLNAAALHQPLLADRYHPFWVGP